MVQIPAHDLNKLKEFETYVARLLSRSAWNELAKNIPATNHIENMHKDLTALLIQAQTENFKFNAYILKMIICKIEFAMSEMIVSSGANTQSIYQVLFLNRQYLIKLLDELISPF